MATRLESGNVQVRQVGGAPMQQVVDRPVNYMVAANAKANEANALAQILDNMSNSVFEYAAKKRFDEGLQYAAQNPLTAEQLQLASGIDPDTGGKLPGGPMPEAMPGIGKISSDIGYFGQAVKKARTLELSSHFEIEGRNDLTKLLTDVQNGIVTSDQVNSKIANMTNGYAKSLSAIDSEASIKFRATMATHGNTVLNAAYEAELKRAKAQRIAKFDMDFDNSARLVEQAVTESPAQIDEMANVFRRNIGNQSLLLGDAALQTEYSTKFETVLRNSKINALTKELTDDKYMADPVATLAKIRNGDAGNLSPVLQSLIKNDFDAVAKVTANFMAAHAQRATLDKEKKDADKQAALKLAVPLIDRAYALADNSPERRKLTDQIVEIHQKNPDAIPFGIIKDLREPNKEGNLMAEFNALAAIFDGRITSPNQIASIAGLNGKQKVNLLKTLTSEDRRDQRDLDTGLARLAGIPTMPGQITVIDPKGTEFQQLLKLRSKAQQIQSEMTLKGEIGTPSNILRKVEEDILRTRNTESAKAARQSLLVFEKKDWINGPITRNNLSAIEQKAGKDINKQRELKRIKDLLDQAGE
jgi:hypothetical protein